MHFGVGVGTGGRPVWVGLAQFFLETTFSVVLAPVCVRGLVWVVVQLCSETNMLGGLKHHAGRGEPQRAPMNSVHGWPFPLYMFKPCLLKHRL